MKPLAEYKRKRNFKSTREPDGDLKQVAKKSKLIFVVQEHHASHLHYDFRLEWDGVLKSWAVPKGPTLDPEQKRLAVEVEDHPIPYAKFTGTIPKGEYGGGEVYRWDMGTWQPVGDAEAGLKKGHLEFVLKGAKLKGGFRLIRTRRSSGGKNQWLLMKRHDDFAQPGQILESVAPSGKKTRITSLKKKAQSLKTNRDAFPEFIAPQLATLVDHPPKGDDWVHELKFDGYRTEAHWEAGRLKLYSRSGKDWTDKYPSVQKALKKLKVESAVFDGEVVALDERGRSNFQQLQGALKAGKTSQLVYYIFDLLYLDGKDLTSLPLIARKERLEKIVSTLKDPHLRFSEHFRGVGEGLLKASCSHDLEGIVSKRVDRPYVSGRHDDWVKAKCTKRQEFVIGGFSEGTGSRVGFGALLLGVYEGGKLRYVGRCGTGFDHRTLLDVHKKMRPLEIAKSPFELKSPKGREVHFVKPKLVAEVTFAEWTSDEILRVPVFHGLRIDKAPEQIIREKPKHVAGGEVKALKVKLTHPDKIIYAKEKLAKQDVAEYYQAVAKWMVPHLADRPLSLVRCPQGAGKACFYSKHFEADLPESLIAIPQVGEDKHEAPWIAIDSAEGLQTLVQRGSLEIHPWGCHRETIEFPDQIVMDFDPDPALDFEKVKEGALELREMLDHLKLKSYLKTTGGKGLHVQFPFQPLYTWDQVKEFSRTLVEEMVSRHPDLYTVKLAKAARKGKIFIDYLRNGRGATAVAPYSLRAREPSAVAMPIAWDELEALRGANIFTLKKALSYLEKRKTDPWKDYLKLKQEIGILKKAKTARRPSLRVG